MRSRRSNLLRVLACGRRWGGSSCWRGGGAMMRKWRNTRDLAASTTRRVSRASCPSAIVSRSNLVLLGAIASKIEFDTRTILSQEYLVPRADLPHWICESFRRVVAKSATPSCKSNLAKANPCSRATSAGVSRGRNSRTPPPRRFAPSTTVRDGMAGALTESLGLTWFICLCREPLPHARFPGRLQPNPLHSLLDGR